MLLLTIHVIDLNPASFKYLELNKKKNHCQRTLHCYNLDARQFIVQLNQRNIVFDEVIMNLPQNAIEFLDVFVGLETRRRRLNEQ